MLTVIIFIFRLAFVISNKETVENTVSSPQ
jgi:hypothetical protein